MSTPPLAQSSQELARRLLRQRLLDQLPTTGGPLLARAPDLMWEQGRRCLHAVTAEDPSRFKPGPATDALIQSVLDEALGLGPLEPLMKNQAITEIMVVGPDRLFIETAGCLRRLDAGFSSAESLRVTIDRVLSPIGRRVDEAHPLADGRLPDGSRVHVALPPVSLAGPCLTLRKRARQSLQMKDLLSRGALDTRLARLLRGCVRGRKNLLISGGTGSGKTTLLGILASFVDPSERILTLEDTAELALPQPHVVSLEARPANAEGKGEISIRTLVRNALRMRPDRIIIGECRGGEALDLLAAMNTGHNGSMATLHANHPTDAALRLEALATQADSGLPSPVLREQIVAAVDVIVQVNRCRDGVRRVTHVSEVSGLSASGQVEVVDIYRWDTSEDHVGRWISTGHVPSFLGELLEQGAVDGEDPL